MASVDDYPLQPPPPGQSSNFIDPKSRGPAVVAVCCTFISLMWLFFLLRLYSKTWVIRKVGWDDAFATLSAIGATAQAAITIWNVDIKTIGPHGWDVRAASITANRQRVTITGSGVLGYSLTLLFAKLALFLLYYRLFASDYWTKIAIYLGIITSCLFHISSSIISLIWCLPRPSETWTSPRFYARCKLSFRLGDAQGAFALLSDLYIFLLPLPVLWGMHMPLKKKIGVTTIFLTGLIAIVATCLGVYYRYLEDSIAHYSDFPWDGPPGFALSVVEAAIGVICGSVPNLPVLFRRPAPGLSCITESLLVLLFSCGGRSKKSHELPRYIPNGFNSKPKTPWRRQVETDVWDSILGEAIYVRKTRDAQSLLEHSEGSMLPRDGCATRRHHHDMSITTNIFSSDKTSQPPAQDMESVVETARRNNRSDVAQKGYWDIMSIFRSRNTNSTVESASWPRSRSRSGHP